MIDSQSFDDLTDALYGHWLGGGSSFLRISCVKCHYIVMTYAAVCVYVDPSVVCVCWIKAHNRCRTNNKSTLWWFAALLLLLALLSVSASLLHYCQLVGIAHGLPCVSG